jgi:hypothetical protein
MHGHRAVAVILLALIAVAVAMARQPESIEDMKLRAESAKPGDQPKLFLAVAEKQLQAADQAYAHGDTTGGHAAVDDMATLCEKAVGAAVSTHKHLKDSEIKLRELGRKLDSVRRTLSFEDRAALQGAVDRVEAARNKLVEAMFGPKS